MKLSQLRNDDSAVSPVIGVILMVAITVILAAVIATFVLGIGETVNEGVQAGVVVEGANTTSATVTWASQGNADRIEIRKADGTQATADTAGNNPITSIGGSADISTAGSYSAVAISDENDAEAVLNSFEVVAP
jgi:flagellin-like protein